MKKIGLISDIHGNYHAAKAVIDDAEGLKMSSDSNGYVQSVKEWLEDENNQSLFEKYKLKS